MKPATTKGEGWEDAAADISCDGELVDGVNDASSSAMSSCAALSDTPLADGQTLLARVVPVGLPDEDKAAKDADIRSKMNRIAQDLFIFSPSSTWLFLLIKALSLTFLD